MVKPSSSIGHIFPEPPLKAFRKCENIQHILRRKKKSPPDPNPGTFPCNRSRCVTCSHTIQSISKIQINNVSFTIFKHFSCISACLIYGITCSLCPDVIYIGQTKNRLADRFGQHLRDINNQNDTVVSRHFCSSGHSSDHCKITALCFAPQDEDERLTLEDKIILKFHGRTNILNKKCTFISLP